VDEGDNVLTNGLSDKQSYSGIPVIRLPGYCDRFSHRSCTSSGFVGRTALTLSTRMSLAWHV